MQNLDGLVAEFVRLYEAEGRPDIPVGGQLQSLLARIDGHYWSEAEAAVAEAVVPEAGELRFDPARRLRLDSGLLDPRLLCASGGPAADEALAAGLTEGTDSGIWLLSEWLSDRSQTFGILSPMSSGGAATDQAPAHEERRRIYASLSPLFDHLAGVPANVMTLLCSGRIDMMIQKLTPTAGTNPRTREQHDKLRAVRDAILRQARRRCTLRQQLSLFDALEELDQAEEHRAPAAPAEVATASGAGVEERRRFLLTELRLVRALLRLGAPGSGVSRIHSVLVGSRPRTRRPALAALLRQVHVCDPRLPDPLRICIAPYTGTGFFEWDRDTVFVPLTPTRSEDEALLAALGHYRLLLDTQQDGGRIRRWYEERVGKEHVQRRFLEDYRQWIQGTGRGFRGALPEDTFAFFRDHVGPSAETLFAPAEIRTLAPHEAERMADACRHRLEAGPPAPEDHYRLALLSWREGRGKSALDHMAAAVRVDRANGAYLYALGYLCALRGMREKAQEAYRACLSRAPSTLWAMYAQDALQSGGLSPG